MYEGSMKIRLGYACMNRTLGRKVRGLRLATFHALGLPYLQHLVDENMDLLAEILRWNQAHQIMMYRLSSNLIPFGSHEEVDLLALAFPRAKEIAALGETMRLSMHPGQYTLLSGDGAVWERSYQDLCYHAFLLDLLGRDNSDIIVHGGGVYGDRSAAAARIRVHIVALPVSIQRRLRLENDERCWSVYDLLPICEATGTPLVVDNLHHQLNGGEPLEKLPWERILATWHGQRPKLHYSEQDEAKRPGAHSEYVNAQHFCTFRASIPLEEYDVMLECKAKEQALLRLRADLAERGTMRKSLPIKEGHEGRGLP
jgi:UV DNA damage endonuclease